MMNDKIKDVLIISPTLSFPVPAVKGGAVETLITNLLEENETYQRVHIDVTSMENDNAREVAKTYKYTNCIFFSKPRVVNFIDNIIHKICNHIGKQKLAHTYLWEYVIIRRLRKLVREHDYDAIVIQNASYLLYVFQDKKLLEKYKGKIFFHLHNDISPKCCKKTLYESKLIMISHFLERRVADIYGETMKDKFHILYNGFHTDLFRQKLGSIEREELALKWGIPKSSNVVLFTGRISEKKGIIYLLEAISKLKDENVILLAVGAPAFGLDIKTDFYDKFRHLLSKMPDRVKYTGYVPYHEIWKCYALADVVALPSIWDEPAGLTMIEALAAGKPLITTNVGGILEYVRREYAIVVDRDENLAKNVEDGIRVILNHKEEWNAKAKEGAKFIMENFDSSIFYHNFVNILEEKA